MVLPPDECNGLHTKAVGEVGKFSGIACSVISRLGFGNFYAEKQRNNKVLPFGARGAANYASLCIFSILS